MSYTRILMAQESFDMLRRRKHGLIKRACYLFLSIVEWLVLLPIILAITILLIILGEREIFYVQGRLGYNRILPRIYKLAIMIKDGQLMRRG